MGARYHRSIPSGYNAVDYFTKSTEVEALANIQDVDVKKFVWRNIVTGFGVPKSLVSDNRL